jgi:hypothetical protein
MSTKRARASEKERRRLAQDHRGEVVEGSGEVIEPRRLDQMLSVRLDPDLVVGLRELAASTGASVSDLLRQGALLVLQEAHSIPYQLSYDVTVTSPLGGHERREFWGKDSPTQSTLRAMPSSG